jgi:hypothetical protein
VTGRDESVQIFLKITSCTMGMQPYISTASQAFSAQLIGIL